MFLIIFDIVELTEYIARQLNVFPSVWHASNCSIHIAIVISSAFM